MTQAYIAGFMAKMAEAGVRPDAVRSMLSDRRYAAVVLKMAGVLSDDGHTFTLQEGGYPGQAVSEWNSKNPESKITIDDIVAANGGLGPTRYRAGTVYRMPGSPDDAGEQGADEEPAAEGPSREELDAVYGGMTPVQQNLAKVLYDEARETPSDMPYVAATAYNRAGNTGNIKNVLDTGVFNGKKENGEYLSYARRYDNPREMSAWNEAMKQALAVYADGYLPPTTATHFYSGTSAPDWASGKTPLNVGSGSLKFFDDVTFKRPWIATKMPEITDRNGITYTIAAVDNPAKIGKKLGGIPAEWIMAWNPGLDERRMRTGKTIRYVPLPEDYMPLLATGKTVEAERKRKSK